MTLTQAQKTLIIKMEQSDKGFVPDYVVGRKLNLPYFKNSREYNTANALVKKGVLMIERLIDLNSKYPNLYYTITK